MNTIIKNIRSNMQDIRPVYEALESSEPDLAKKFVLGRIISNIDKTLEAIEKAGEITEVSEINEDVEKALEYQSMVVDLINLYDTLLK